MEAGRVSTIAAGRIIGAPLARMGILSAGYEAALSMAACGLNAWHSKITDQIQ
jgi:hypothetical protein